LGVVLALEARITKDRLLDKTKELRVPEVVPCLGMHEDGAHAREIGGDHIGEDLVTDQNGLLGRYAFERERTPHCDRGGFHGVSNRIAAELVGRDPHLARVEVVRDEADLETRRPRPREPCVHPFGCHLGTTRDAGVVTIEQDEPHAPGPELAYVDEVERGHVPVRGEDAHDAALRVLCGRDGLLVLFVRLGELVDGTRDEEVVVAGGRGLEGSLDGRHAGRADRGRRKAAMEIAVVGTVGLEVVRGDLATRDVPHGRIALELHAIAKAVIEDGGDERTVVVGHGLALDDRGEREDVVIAHRDAVGAPYRGLGRGEVDLGHLDLVLVEHGAYDEVGRDGLS